MINIKGLNKAAVLAALHNASRTMGMGVMHDIGRDMTTAEAQAIVDNAMRGSTRSRLYFDYVSGRVVKCDITKDEFDPWLFDRDIGEGAALRAIEAIQKCEGNFHFYPTNNDGDCKCGLVNECRTGGQ